MGLQLIYFSNERIPGSSACAIQQMNMCEAFALAGADVTLIRPFYFELANQSLMRMREFYGVKDDFAIHTLPSLLSLSKPENGSRSSLKFRIPGIGGASVLAATWFLLATKAVSGAFDAPTIIYSRNVNAAAIFLRQRSRLLKNKPVSIFYEAHSMQQQPEGFFEYVLTNADGLVAITQSLKDAIIGKYKVDGSRIFVGADGVRAERVTSPPMSKAQARATINMAGQYEKLVLYTGQILPGKGVETFIDAVKELDERTGFLIVGGSPAMVDQLRARTRADQISNMQFTGMVAPSAVASFQAAADVLVLPNTHDSSISPYTSPLKLFEYMSARRPIVASDLPVFREVLCDGENSLLFSPGDPRALSQAISRLLSDDALAERLASKAFADVQQYTWEKRARRILDFIEEQKGQRKSKPISS
jgi:glycosyltransferase involved in cell wall biosynthesis